VQQIVTALHANEERNASQLSFYHQLSWRAQELRTLVDRLMSEEREIMLRQAEERRAEALKSSGGAPSEARQAVDVYEIKAESTQAELHTLWPLVGRLRASIEDEHEAAPDAMSAPTVGMLEATSKDCAPADHDSVAAGIMKDLLGLDAALAQLRARAMECLATGGRGSALDEPSMVVMQASAPACLPSPRPRHCTSTSSLSRAWRLRRGSSSPRPSAASPRSRRPCARAARSRACSPSTSTTCSMWRRRSAEREPPPPQHIHRPPSLAKPLSPLPSPLRPSPRDLAATGSLIPPNVCTCVVFGGCMWA